MILWQSLAAGRGQGSAPLLVFLAGSNGAGKTTFFEAYLADLGLPFVNADRIAAELRKSHPGHASNEIDRVAFEQAEALRLAFMEAGVSFCTETVFSDPAGAKIEYLKESSRRGFVIVMVFIGIENEDFSIARVMQRVSQGGHDIPDDKLRTRYSRTLNNLRDAMPIVDEAFLFDNSSFDIPFRAIGIYSRGKLVSRHPPLPGWAKGLPGM